MPKLPNNLVKPPAFDNPLRRTTPTFPPESTEAPASLVKEEIAQAPSGVVIPIVASTRAEPDHASAPAATPEPHRITVRIDDATRCALETECHRRRIAGEKTNLAEIARGILRSWGSSTGAR